MVPLISSPRTGSAWAAILASGIGCAAFGVTVDLAELFPRLSDVLKYVYSPAGDLPGKAVVAIVLWIAAWVVLDFRWKQRDIANPARITLISTLLVLVGCIAVFPPFTEMLPGL